MTFKADDRVRETSVTQGVGDYTVDGAPPGFQPFSSLGAGNYCPYFATDDVNWETGIGQVLAAPNRLARTKILASSNADAAVNWGVGTKKLRCGMPASLAFPRYLAKDVAGAAGTTVLTQDESRVRVLELTGALTGNRVLEVDATPWNWIVYNNTTGAFTLTVRVTGQVGVLVPQGKRAALYCDGTDVRAVVGVPGTGASEFAAGTAAVFAQTAAPMGWTKSTTHNDKALRVVSGVAGSGGAVAFTSVFGAGKVTGADTPSIAKTAAHTHGGTYLRFDVGNTGTGPAGGTVTTSGIDANGGGGSHDHTLSLDLQYVDVIIATKD